MKKIEKEKLLLSFVDPIKAKKPQNKCINDVCLSLITLIDNAKETIDIAAYGFDGQDEIINAIREAKLRGVKIRGVVDNHSQKLYKRTNSLIDEFSFKTDSDFIKQGSFLEDSLNYSKNILMHNKFVIVDKKFLWTGSTNITNHCMTYNSNNSVVINSAEVASIYIKEFEQMYNDDKYHLLKNIVNDKNNLTINNKDLVTIMFSPQDKAITQGIIPLIENAQQRIYISVFYLTNHLVTNSLIKAYKKGVDIKIIVDASLQKEPKSQIYNLLSVNIPLKVENWPGKMHQKSMVIDSNTLVVASTNWTRSSEYYNDENMLIINSKKLAKQQEKEFLRLWNQIH